MTLIWSKGNISDFSITKNGKQKQMNEKTIQTTMFFLDLTVSVLIKDRNFRFDFRHQNFGFCIKFPLNGSINGNDKLIHARLMNREPFEMEITC